MRIEPFAHVALVRAALRGELGGGERATRGQHAVQAEAVADDHQRRQRSGAEVGDGAAQQAVQRFFVDEGGGLLLHDVLQCVGEERIVAEVRAARDLQPGRTY